MNVESIEFRSLATAPTSTPTGCLIVGLFAARELKQQAWIAEVDRASGGLISELRAAQELPSGTG